VFSYVTLELFRQYGIICFSIGLWICSDSVALFVSLLNFRTVPTVYFFLFFYVTLELFRQYGIICFSIRFWNYSDNVALLVFLLDFRTVLTVWHYLFFIFQLGFGNSLTL